MSGHTPGPWRFALGKDNSGDDEDATLGSIVTTSELGDFHIARVWSDGPAPNADARLIAAAPEMLEALRATELLLNGSQPTAMERGTIIRMARAAIDKAEGRPPEGSPHAGASGPT